MTNFQPFTGTVTDINDFFTEDPELMGCNKIISVENRDGSPVNFVVLPSTYFIDHVTIKKGDRVTGYYDINAPTPLIFPPQLRCIAMFKNSRNQNVKLDFFNEDLISKDGMLKLNISQSTKILLRNNQTFTGSLKNRTLLVIYGSSTKSIPAITTPSKIIIMC